MSQRIKHYAVCTFRSNMHFTAHLEWNHSSHQEGVNDILPVTAVTTCSFYIVPLLLITKTSQSECLLKA
jgi:hypothetical protein